QEQNQRGTVVRRERRAVAGLGRAQDEWIADRPAAHEHVAFPAGGLRLRGTLGESAHLERALAVGDREQRVGERPTPQGRDTLDGIGRGAHVDQGALVARQRERRVGTGQRQQRDRFRDRARLRRLGPQELAARGRIEEQGTHRHRRPPLAHDVVDRFALAADQPQPGAGDAVRRGLELEPGHRGDRGQRLAPEAERADADQVGGLADLARGVARQRQLRVGAAHSLAVVAHPDQALPAVLDFHADRPRSGVERVLHELLHDRRGPLHDFAGRDLIRHLGSQHGDPHGALHRHSRVTSAASTQPRTPSWRCTSSHPPKARSTSSAAPASTVAAALALPYGATRTDVAGCTTIAMGWPRRSASRTPSPTVAAVASATVARTTRRRPPAATIHMALHNTAATRAHSPGVANPTTKSGSLGASGGGSSSRARRTVSSRGASRAAMAHAAIALPSAPARYSVAPRLYQCAGARGSAAARAAKESAAARSAPASYNASALTAWAAAGRANAAARSATATTRPSRPCRLVRAGSPSSTRSTCSSSDASCAASPGARGPYRAARSRSRNRIT